MVLPATDRTKSFWIEAAESPLRNHRSTDELPSETDVVIVGSGYTGATAAYWLSKFTENGTTPKMVMLEARDVCGAATGRNGGQLRPHFYSRYPRWSELFGPAGALALIEHEAAHLTAFKELFESEGITEEVCFKLGETFDAAMSDEAWTLLRGAYEAMKADHGEQGACIRDCRLIEDPKEAEAFTQMKGCIGAVVHPTGQVWPYKFVHALLRIVMEAGNLNLQSHTPALSIEDKDENGWITVKTERGDIKAKAVIHASNRWVSHLLEDFDDLVYPGRGSLAAIKAPEGFIKHTGAQHWDSVVNNYHLQLPAPYNAIIIGGAKGVTVPDPTLYVNNDDDTVQMPGVPEFYKAWPAADVVGWEGKDPAELGKEVEDGGVWTGIYSVSVDGFPWVGPAPDRQGQFVAAGFTGHGMPRILGSTAYLVPLVLDALGLQHTTPAPAKIFPPLPDPFHITHARIDTAKNLDAESFFAQQVLEGLESAKKPFTQKYKTFIP